MNARDVVLDEFGKHYLGDERVVDPSSRAWLPGAAAASAARMRRAAEPVDAVVLLLAELRADRRHPLFDVIAEQTLLAWTDAGLWPTFRDLATAMIASLDPDVTVVTHDFGHELHPVNPLRTLLVVGSRGGVRFTWQHLRERRAWTARLVDGAWDEIARALEAARFPEKPAPRILAADTPSSTLARSRGAALEEVHLSGAPQYEPISHVCGAIGVAIGGKAVFGYALPNEPQRVADVAETSVK